MASSEELSYAFLEAHPTDAARVLERLAATEAGALLQSVPLRLAAPVLRQMLPLAGAHCLEPLEDTQIAGLLHSLGVQAGVALLRHFGAERRARLMAQLPAALVLAYELLLGYPEQTVGAWMDVNAMALPADMTVGESLERVRRADEVLAGDPFVITRSQRLLGYVELADLLRANTAVSLDRLVRPCAHKLPAQALLAGLLDHQGWHVASTLPVIEHDDRLVGAFTHAALQRALAIEQEVPQQNHAADTYAGIASAYWFGVSSLVKAVVSQFPVERREEEA
jgi:magnesium transporter